MRAPTMVVVSSVNANNSACSHSALSRAERVDRLTGIEDAILPGSGCSGAAVEMKCLSRTDQMYRSAFTRPVLLQGLQLLAGFEAHGFAGRNGDFRAGARIAADAGLARLHVEDAEAAQFDAVAVLERFLHPLEDRLDRHLGLGLGDAGPVHHFVDDIQLDHDASAVFRQPDDIIDFTPMSSIREEARPIDPDRFRAACSKYATGITIVTALDSDGVPHGMTANSFTSVSLFPPLVLVCIDHTAGVLGHLRASLKMGLNVLNDSQRHLSAHFARPGEDRFGAVEWLSGRSGVPLLPDVLATFECAIIQTVDAGDHAIVVGEVYYADFHDGRPLLYFDRGYRAIDGDL